ncbi:hypothetical protein BcDW1_3540 [Botrytis cinerea BcDW1]|uniref:2EXR domain-containing protein n=1 Tax=Botryotinia fuckeliana (strain BcDW1) TaxID=1290391 RepID=M7ULW3_BOTF1|nr:hypothetical protein BcDW1_3540 [Botrytis cinerea BcDW1]
MTATTISPSTFPLFSSLALELRAKILEESLPSEFPPALYFYKEGCWHPRIFTKSDLGYSDKVSENVSTEDLNSKLEFRHDLLDNITVRMPLLFVNHEARKITLTWARNHGIETCGDTLFPCLSLPFNPIRDILYVSVNRWDDLFDEPYQRSIKDDMIGLNHRIFNEVQRLAVPKSMLGVSFAMDTFNELSDYYRIEELDGSSLQLKESRENEDEELYLLSKDVAQYLTPGFIANTPSIREIRPVLAVKG